MTTGKRRGLPRTPAELEQTQGEQPANAEGSRVSDAAQTPAATSPPQQPATRRGLPRKGIDAGAQNVPVSGDAPVPATTRQGLPHAISPATSEANESAPRGRRGLVRTAPGTQGRAAPLGTAPAQSAPEAPRTQSPARSSKAKLDATGGGWFSSRTTGQKIFALLGGLLGLLVVFGIAVFAVSAFMGLDFMQRFLQRFPGEYPLPESTVPGFPGWVQWQHFFNVFLMVLIIRSGLQVRTEKRPDAYWTPKWSKNGKGKISLALWFHQSLDILWFVNGIVFIVLLFATGHWMRIVPTSWEVFPNALSAMLQYISLDWPTENGWVNYNSLQQLMYFITVFIAAPLAAITGIRMSGLWPKGAKKLSAFYPVEWARALHFPVMLYFVLFIVVHVALVFATGALRNLNHMFGGSTQENWAGFWIFFTTIVVIIAAWTAARPLVLAPIAKLSGKVTSR